jgi:hypothetical protein
VIVFDPSAACDVSGCNAIRLIQVQQDVGDLDGLLILIPPSAQEYADIRQPTYTNSGFMVDAWGPSPGMHVADTRLPALGEQDPYVNGDDFGYDLPPSTQATTVGFAIGDSTNITRGRDAPYASEGRMVRLQLNAIMRRFETCAFCSSGDQKGRFYGKVTWRWRRARGGAATIDSTVTSREPPSPMFMEALARWEAVRGRKVPRTAPPTQGGGPC